MGWIGCNGWMERMDGWIGWVIRKTQFVFWCGFRFVQLNLTQCISQTHSCARIVFMCTWVIGWNGLDGLGGLDGMDGWIGWMDWMTWMDWVDGFDGLDGWIGWFGWNGLG